MRIFINYVILLILPTTLRAQENPINSAYFIDINNGNNGVVYDIASASLNLQYYDKVGKENTLPLTVFNWESDEIASFIITKSFGQNHFRINLGETFSSWKTGDVYRCELRDENGQKYRILLKKTEMKTQDLDVDLKMNPIRLDCENLSGNLVEFFATIQGGKPPYIANWFIMDESKNNLLYQPGKQEISSQGKSGTVRVESNPNYYVMILVTDACGNEKKEMIYLVCEKKKKKINTLFVEPLNELPQIQKNTK
jgi:hypothetical protein